MITRASGRGHGTVTAAPPWRVDVRAFSLGLDAPDLARATALLDATERARAARLRTGAAPWIAARAALREVLGEALGLDPGRVAFVTDARGKPRLAPHLRSDLHFSLSHSGGIALVATRTAHDVGVDVEEIRADVDALAVARLTLPPGECASLLAGAGDSRRAFFRAWVRREALAKACGRGIAEPATDDDRARYHARDLDAPAGFAAAVASAGTAWEVAFTPVAAPLAAH